MWILKARKMLGMYFITSITAAIFIDYLILSIMLISIMFDLNSFYRIKVLKFRYLCFFFTKATVKKSKNLFCVTRPQ